MTNSDPLWTNTAVMSASEASSSTSPSQNSTCPHSSSLSLSSCLVHTSDLITPTTSSSISSGCGIRTPDAGTAGVECICQPTSKLEHTVSIIDEPPKATSTTNEPKLIPVPPPNPKRCGSILAHKLWIGNLDKRLTEQNILKFVTQYGKVVSFRYLFKTTSERMEPRRYVFVEYATREEAERAKVGLDGKKALGRKIIVDWARTDYGLAKKTVSAVSDTWDASSVSKTLDRKASTTSKIAALEAKLRQMEESERSSKRPCLSTTPISHTLTVRNSKRPVY